MPRVIQNPDVRPRPAAVRIIKHEALPKTGSYEVCYCSSRPSVYFYWDDIASRRLRPEMLTGNQAIEAAKTLARRG